MNDQDIELSAMPTPNPNTIKFIVNRQFFEKGSIEFDEKSKAERSPLAKQLLEVNHVESLMVGNNFIAITKSDDSAWDPILEGVTDRIKTILKSEENPIDLSLIQSVQDSSLDDDEAVQKIKTILDNEIRPAIAMDGGDCQFHSYVDGILTLHLQGACSTCPSSTYTLKMGIESRLKEEVEGLKEVIQV